MYFESRIIMHVSRLGFLVKNSKSREFLVTNFRFLVRIYLIQRRDEWRKQ